MLRFLRVKKFLNAEAFKCYEKLLVNYESYGKWFKNLSLDDESLLELVNKGYIIPLKERDRNGCRVILAQPKVFDTKKFTEDHIYRSFFLSVMTLLEEPETQVSGITVIVDFKDVKLDYITLFSLMELKHLAHCLQNAVPMRLKQSNWVNFPAFGVRISEIVRGFASKKMNERAKITVDDQVIYESIDKKFLPTEYGGEAKMSDLIENFKALIAASKDKLKRADEQSIDLERVQGYEPAESFKKLEID